MTPAGAATSTKRLGFIGIGNLGMHLAGSLLRAGYALTIFDLNKAAAKTLLAAGARWADSPAEVGKASDTVFTCLPSSKAVSAVVSAAMACWPAWLRVARGST